LWKCAAEAGMEVFYGQLPMQQPGLRSRSRVSGKGFRVCRWVGDVNLIEILSKGAQGTENGKCAAVRELLCAQEALS